MNTLVESKVGAFVYAACAASFMVGVTLRESERESSRQLVFAPPMETSLSLSSSASIELTLENSRTFLRDDPLDREQRENFTAGLAEEGDTIAITWSSLCRDTYHSVSAARPLRFDRRWEELELAMERKGDELLEPTSLRIESKLVDESMEHAWIAKERSHRVMSAEDRRRRLSDSIASLGTPLAFPLMLEERIPEDAREWSIDPARFAASMWPGGWGELGYGDVENWPTLVIHVPGLPPDPCFWLEDVEGSVRAVLAPARLVDGEELEIIRLEFEIGSRHDLGDWFLALGWRFHWAQRMADSYAGEIRWTWIGNGELAWSKSKGVPRSLTLSGALGVDYDLRCTFEFFQIGNELTVRLDETWKGTMSFRESDPR